VLLKAVAILVHQIVIVEEIDSAPPQDIVMEQLDIVIPAIMKILKDPKMT